RLLALPFASRGKHRLDGRECRIRMHGSEQLPTLRGERELQLRPRTRLPRIKGCADDRYPSAALLSVELGEQRRPARLGGNLLGSEKAEPLQRILQFVGRRGIGPCLGAHSRDRLRIEPPDLIGGSRIEPPPAHDRLSASL